MPFFDLYDDPEDVDCLVVATHRAIAEHFTEADWTQFAYETGTRNYVLNHERLLRSLRWHDQDYESCIFEVLHHFSEQKVSVFEALVRHPKIHPEIECSVPTILQRLGLLSAHVPPVATTGLSAPDVVSRALLDADALLSTSDAVSCIGRLHTTIHGYFRSEPVKKPPRWSHR